VVYYPRKSINSGTRGIHAVEEDNECDRRYRVDNVCAGITANHESRRVKETKQYSKLFFSETLRITDIVYDCDRCDRVNSARRRLRPITSRGV